MTGAAPMSEFPGALLFRWCYNLPTGYGLRLAHLYLICTAPDMTPFFLEGGAIWQDFRSTLEKPDIPARMAVRACSAMAVLEFLLERLALGQRMPADSPLAGLMVPADAPEGVWREIAESLTELAARHCGSEQVSQWLERALQEASD
jgi:hypothetical protein